MKWEFSFDPQAVREAARGCCSGLPAMVQGMWHLRWFFLPWLVLTLVLPFSPHCRAMGKLWYLKATSAGDVGDFSPGYPNRVWNESVADENKNKARVLFLGRPALVGKALPSDAAEAASVDYLVASLLFKGQQEWPDQILENVLRRPGAEQAALNCWVAVRAIESTMGGNSEARQYPYSRQFLLRCTARARQADPSNAFPVVLERSILSAWPTGSHTRETQLLQDALGKPYYDNYASLAAHHALRALKSGHATFLSVRIQGVNSWYQRSNEYLLPGPEFPDQLPRGFGHFYARLFDNMAFVPLSVGMPSSVSSATDSGLWHGLFVERELKSTSVALNAMAETSLCLALLAGGLWCAGGVVLWGAKPAEPARAHVWLVSAVAVTTGGALGYSAVCCDDGSLLLGETSTGFALQAGTLVGIVLPALLGWVLVLRRDPDLRRSWHHEGRLRRLWGLNSVGGRWEVIVLLVLVAHIVSGLLIWNAALQWLGQPGNARWPLVFLQPQPWSLNSHPLAALVQASLGQFAIVGTYCLGLYWLWRLRFGFTGGWRQAAHTTIGTWRSVMALWAVGLSWVVVGASVAQIPLEHELEKRVMALCSRLPQNAKGDASRNPPAKHKPSS